MTEPAALEVEFAELLAVTRDWRGWNARSDDERAVISRRMEVLQRTLPQATITRIGTHGLDGPKQPPSQTSLPTAQWPVADPAIFHGPAGAYALDAAPHTEADPVGVLVSLLAGIGSTIGSGPHALAGNDRHGCAVWPVLVGATSKGGKGTASAAARTCLEHADPLFFAGGRRSRLRSGFGSGEALIDELRDPDPDDEKDTGTDDKRLLVVEPEFARLLKVAGREASILSQVLRQGWDGVPIQANSRARKVSATGYHLVVVGHTTVEELRMRMTDTETYGGLANRFLWVCVRRARRLPQGGNVPDELARKHGEAIRDAIADTARIGRIVRTPPAEERWATIYTELADDEPAGLLGAAVGRDAPQVLRMSVLYALLDGQRTVDVEHLEAAHALWRYCRASAAHVWQDATGNTDADKLLAALKRAGDDGLTGKQVSDLFGRNLGADRITAVRKSLIDNGLAYEQSVRTGGRPALVLRLSSLVRIDSSNGHTHP